MPRIINDIERQVRQACSEFTKEINDVQTPDTNITGVLGMPSISIQVSGNAYDSIMQQINESISEWKQIIATDLLSRLNLAMSSNLWNNGDLIDTGNLRDSVSINITSTGVQISYDAPYANLIHYGGYIVPYGNTNIDKVYIPASPWAQSVIFGDGPFEAYDYQEAYAIALSRIG